MSSSSSFTAPSSSFTTASTAASVEDMLWARSCAELHVRRATDAAEGEIRACKNFVGRRSALGLGRAPLHPRALCACVHYCACTTWCAMFRSRGFRGFRPRNSTSQAVHLATLTVIGVVSGETFRGTMCSKNAYILHD